MIKGVFFDLGGTLFSYRNVPRATFPVLIEAAERLGLSVDSHQIKRAHLQAGQDTNRLYADKPYYLHSDFFRDTFVRFIELLECNVNHAVCDWYVDTHRMAMVDCLALKDDCIPTLVRLKQAGLYLSVASNIDDDMLAPLIKRERLADYFDHWTSSEAAQSCKPDLRFFEHCLERSELPAAEVLFVGDSPEHDIVGAHAAGMQTALIVDGGMEPPLQTGRDTVKADRTVSNLTELAAALTGA